MKFLELTSQKLTKKLYEKSATHLSTKLLVDMHEYCLVFESELLFKYHICSFSLSNAIKSQNQNTKEVSKAFTVY